ncbi:DUF6708 domain-containing protein [Lysobacter sp. H23M47]|uniref:DUF6708 domain-containing protein n=1 Tax=Lysobacter sp. H23M47 TaxID=2781024 RepID=UPI00187ED620|nr:DUF6708 domain-containing protein [Lysobacter sp. H23M47]QOW24776.1 hypothetical protein INQ43_01445 [Lysobacter sp. H23M47]
MDFTGLNRFTAYKLNRPLTCEEKANQLQRHVTASAEPLDWLSVIKLDSTYLEVIDRWYSSKGYATWMGLLIGVPIAVFAFAFSFSAIGERDPVMLASVLAIAAIFGSFAYAGWWVVRFDCFRQTHYPIRLNRKTRRVYAYRPDRSIISANWDDLFLCVVENELTMGQTSYDVRAHVLADDGETVVDTFTLAYAYLGERAGLMCLWEYIRRYMEAPDGPQQSYNTTEICMPINGRKEGVVFGLVRTFALMVKWPALQLLASPLWALTTWGRWIAMATCKVPVWPAEIEAACQPDPDDPYRKDWRSNGRYGRWELVWPAICLVVGSLVVLTGVVWLVEFMWGAFE